MHFPLFDMPSTIAPGVYSVSAVNEKKSIKYFITKEYNSFVVPDKIYGKTNSRVKHFWNTYQSVEGCLGVLLVGDKGSGKSEFAKLLSNTAIIHNMPVIIFKNLEVTTELISFIDKLSNVVIFLDEFSKQFRYNTQEKMLTTLSGVATEKKLYILTDENTHSIVKSIIDRPGRVRYFVRFNKLEKDVLEEYCKDYNVTEEFYSDLLDRYRAAISFSFDQMEKLINEHVLYPEMKLKDMLDIMNTKNLTKQPEFYPVNVYTEDNPTGEGISITDTSYNANFAMEDFTSGGSLKFYIKEGDRDVMYRVSKNDMIENDDNVITFRTSDNKYIIVTEYGVNQTLPRINENKSSFF